MERPLLSADITSPTALARSPSTGAIYVGSTYRVVRLLNGVATTVLGAWYAAYGGDGGLATAGTMVASVFGLAVDNSGNQLLIS